MPSRLVVILSLLLRALALAASLSVCSPGGGSQGAGIAAQHCWQVPPSIIFIIVLVLQLLRALVVWQARGVPAGASPVGVVLTITVVVVRPQPRTACHRRCWPEGIC